MDGVPRRPSFVNQKKKSEKKEQGTHLDGSVVDDRLLGDEGELFVVVLVGRLQFALHRIVAHRLEGAHRLRCAVSNSNNSTNSNNNSNNNSTNNSNNNSQSNWQLDEIGSNSQTRPKQAGYTQY